MLGLKSLDESLNDYLRVEELNGENQYFCESCQSRVDASRSIKLRTLPRVLNIQLKRYVFLPKVLHSNYNYVHRCILWFFIFIMSLESQPDFKNRSDVR